MIKSVLKTISRSYLYRWGMVSRPTLLKVTLNVTNYCNLKCKTCAIWKIYEKDPALAQEELTLDEYYKLFEELEGLSYIEFSGGEPFMREDFVEMVKGAASQIKSLKTCSVTTNGLLEEKVVSGVRLLLDALPARTKLVVGVSIDGTPDVHYSQRRVHQSFDNAIDTFLNLREISKKNPKLDVHVAYTISGVNGGELPKFQKFMQDLGVDFSEITITYQHAGFLYRTKKAHIKNVSATVDDVKHALQNNRIVFDSGLLNLVKSRFYRFYLKKLIGYISNPTKMVIPCAALTLTAYIDPYGDVYPCVIWPEKVGNIRESSFEQVYRSLVAEKIRVKIANEKCPNCWTPCEAQPSYLMAFPKII